MLQVIFFSCNFLSPWSDVCSKTKSRISPVLQNIIFFAENVSGEKDLASKHFLSVISLQTTHLDGIGITKGCIVAKYATGQY